jgi:hypothetical protein
MNVARIGQSASLHHTMHDAALTAIAMINSVTSSMIAITITATNINQQIVLASNAPLATGKMTITTINQKKQTTRSLGAMARYHAPSTPFQTIWQGIHGLSAWRTWPIKRCQPHKVQWMHTTPQSIIAILAMTITVQWTPTARKLPTMMAEALVATRSATLMKLCHLFGSSSFCAQESGRKEGQML